MTATTPADIARLGVLFDRIAQLGEAIDREITTEVGKRFIRLVIAHGGRHVHAFVDIANGDLLKAAGWKAPAKGARGNLLDDEDFARILRVADPYGSYLYANRRG
jgi:hypothetical protein